MEIEHAVIVDVCAKFFKYVRIEGWLASNFDNNCKEDQVISLQVIGFDGTAEVEYNLPSPSIGSGFLNKGFQIDLFLKNQQFPHNCLFHFVLADGSETIRSIDELAATRIARYRSLSVTSTFKELIGPQCTILDIGGRDRSKLDRSQQFENDVTVFDILAGENVDVVGDAHHLSDYFEKNQFDAAISVCVFEHLAMPWKVVAEMNKVLKVGAYSMLYTHQTIGLHDMPWDFFRFSEDTWPVLFNDKTGFEIIERGSDFEQFVIPFIYHEGKADAEKSAGREASWVITRKTRNVAIEYPVNVSDFTETLYPSGEDNNDPNAIIF